MSVAVEGSGVIDTIGERDAGIDGDVTVHDGIHLFAAALVHQLAERVPVVSVVQHVVVDVADDHGPQVGPCPLRSHQPHEHHDRSGHSMQPS